MADGDTNNRRRTGPKEPGSAEGLSRREFLMRGLRAGAGALAGAALATAGLSALNGLARKDPAEPVPVVTTPEGMTSTEGDSPLSVHAAAKGLLYGAAVVRSYLRDDQEFAAHFAQECSILVPETELKWSALRPSQDKYDFSAADWLASFAEDRTMLMRGHTLVWHDSLPGWLKKTIQRDNASRLMVDHITKVVGHFAGRMHSWDVVNEAIDTGSDRPDRLRKTLWLDNCGSQYIEDAFRAAAAADPRALLVYNEFGLDYDTSDNRAKRAAVLALLSNLRSRGVPVHALGIQAHLQAEQSDNFNPEVLRGFIQQVADLGLQVLITELDVADRSLPANETRRDGAVAAIYNSYLNAVLQEQAVSAVLTWGLSDRYTWMMHEPEREDGASPRPLPLDQNLERKPAWYSMASAFDNAPTRIRKGPGRHVQGIVAI